MDSSMQSTLRRAFTSPMGAPRSLRREKRSIYDWAQKEKFVFDGEIYEIPARATTFPTSSNLSIDEALKVEENNNTNKVVDPKQALRRSNTVPAHGASTLARKAAPPPLQHTKSLEPPSPVLEPQQTQEDADTPFELEAELIEAFTDPRSPAGYRGDFEDRNPFEELAKLRRPSIHTPPQTTYDPPQPKMGETVAAVHDMPSPPATPEPEEEENLMVFDDEPEATVEQVQVELRGESREPEKRQEEEMPSPPATPKLVELEEVEAKVEVQKEVKHEQEESEIIEEPVTPMVEQHQEQEQDIEEDLLVAEEEEEEVIPTVEQESTLNQTVEEPVIVEEPLPEILKEVEQTPEPKPEPKIQEEPSPESIIDSAPSPPTSPPLPPDFTSPISTPTKQRSVEILATAEPPPAPLPEDLIPDTPRVRAPKSPPAPKAAPAPSKLTNIVIAEREIIEDPVPAVETFFGEPKSSSPTAPMEAPRSIGLGIEFSEALEEMANQQQVDPNMVEDVALAAGAVVKRPRMTPALAQRRAHHCLLQGHMFIHHRGPGNGQRPFNPWISCARCGKKKLRQAWQCALIDRCGIVVCGRCRDDMNLGFVVEEEEVREERVWVETFYEGNRVWGRWEREEVVERQVRWGEREVFTDQKEVYMREHKQYQYQHHQHQHQPQTQGREMHPKRKVRGGGWKL
ncbi:hypothetical protein EDC01DRAFT_780465 [Geopyxis carbonaria]|nr:hypothetical protein EDC01DRAFT_780465 [Geopyxis carbonaria]